MKTNLLIVLLLLNFGLAPEKEQKEAGILDCRKEGKYDERKLKHFHHDVEIVRLPTIDSTRGSDLYSLLTYWHEGDSVRKKHDFLIITINDYNRVKWFWEKDSTLKFTIFHDKSLLSESYTYIVQEKSSILKKEK